MVNVQTVDQNMFFKRTRTLTIYGNADMFDGKPDYLLQLRFLPIKEQTAHLFGCKMVLEHVFHLFHVIHYSLRILCRKRREGIDNDPHAVVRHLDSHHVPFIQVVSTPNSGEGSSTITSLATAVIPTNSLVPTDVTTISSHKTSTTSSKVLRSAEETRLKGNCDMNLIRILNCQTTTMIHTVMVSGYTSHMRDSSTLRRCDMACRGNPTKTNLLQGCDTSFQFPSSFEKQNVSSEGIPDNDDEHTLLVSRDARDRHYSSAPRRNTETPNTRPHNLSDGVRHHAGVSQSKCKETVYRLPTLSYTRVKQFKKTAYWLPTAAITFMH
ncbi:hypothetical protein Tco_0634575 [Tanacetum coccineum]